MLCLTFYGKFIIIIKEKRSTKMKKLICIILVLSGFVFPAAAYDGQNTLDIIYGVNAWKNEQITDSDIISESVISNVGTNIYDWFAFSSGRLGADNIQQYQAYNETVLDTINENSYSVPDCERLALCCAACGADISDNGLLQKAVFDNFSRENLKDKIINQLIYALLTLDTHCYTIPENTDLTRYDIICEILSRQKVSGAVWMMNENTPETDLTAMMITALSPYANGGELFTFSQNNVEKSVTIRQALDNAVLYLSSAQADNGTMINWGSSSCETTAQTIIALTTYGIDIETDKRFIKNGNTLFDGMMTYRLENGGFAHSFDGAGNADGYASTQAMYTCVALLRSQNGYRTLYDMQNEFTAEQPGIIQSISNDIDKLDTADTAKIKEILDRCVDVSVCDRRYIHNYSKLEGLLIECGIENTAAYKADELGVNSEYDHTITNLTQQINKPAKQDLNTLNNNFSRLEESMPEVPQKQYSQSQYVQTGLACICGVIAVFVLAENRRKRNLK